METKTIPDYERGLTFEQVWASIKELRESQKETEQLFKEIAKERADEAERRREEDDRRREEAERERKVRAKEAERERKARAEEDERERKVRAEEAERERKVRAEEAERERKARAEEAELYKKEKQEADRLWQEEKKKADRKLNKLIKETQKSVGDLGRRFGELAEHLVAPGIVDRFNEMGYHFGAVAPGGVRIIENKRTIAEIDLLLENGETVMAVEVKVKPDIKDVKDHLERLGKLRDSRRKINDKRKVQGAIAGAIFGAAEKKATIEAGLFVIEQSGDTMKIEVPEGFIPREW